MTEPQVTDVLQSAARLLELSGHGKLLSFAPIEGGRNNRVYRVVGSAGTGILKHYHQAPGSTHDRFATEKAWYSYCQDQQLKWVPEFWGSEPNTRCVLLSEIEGRRLVPNEITEDHVQQAAAFFNDLNSNRHHKLAAEIGFAADARFSFAETLQLIENRMSRLRSLPVLDEVSEAASDWVGNVLDEVWQDVQSRCLHGLSPAELGATWPSQARRLSPSDFGFHNALMTTGGILRFFDFEYAGWDDPAKVICDFFWQVDRPAPRQTMSMFQTAISVDGDVADRVERLFPSFGIKWCSIVLNDFLDDGRARRQFAMGQSNDRRQGQLTKARLLCKDVERQLSAGR